MAEASRILLVDDEPSIVKMVGKRLEVEGFNVLVAMDGQDALAKARAEAPDLIVLDLMLPKLNGYEVCTMLKQDARYQKTPIIIFTAKTQDKDEKMALECGADAYMRKPFRAQELLEKIRSLIAQTAAPGAPPAPPKEVQP
jgi:two-component system alkaline phosphatase synthesis response regulator PhoP